MTAAKQSGRINRYKIPKYLPQCENPLTTPYEPDIMVMQGRAKALKEGGRKMEEMPTNTEYVLRLVLELIDKCESLDELREAVKKVLDDAG